MEIPDRARQRVVLRLGVTGELGQMDFPTVLRALQRGHELLERTAQRVLGSRGDSIAWQLSGLREGSAVTLLEAVETDDVSERELREVLTTYTRDLAEPMLRLPEDDLPLLRELLLDLQTHASGGLLAQVEDEPDSTRVVLDPGVALSQMVIQRPATSEVIGSVTGRLESLNVHGRREAALWNELDRRRVIVSFPESSYDLVHGALRRRVEVFGPLVEDADGRPLRIRLHDMDVLQTDEDLPSLSSLVGSMPDLAGGLSPGEYLAQNRRGLGLG